MDRVQMEKKKRERINSPFSAGVAIGVLRHTSIQGFLLPLTTPAPTIHNNAMSTRIPGIVMNGTDDDWGGGLYGGVTVGVGVTGSFTVTLVLPPISIGSTP